ncbi:strG, partial [Symbiodinium necroappetens]
TNFSYQYPPTLRIQPGRSEEFKRPHRDAEYGHQIGELNFWMPLTDYNMTQATLWVESSPGAEDFQPLAINHGSIAVFHGTLCRHKVPANTSPFTRVSLDFRIGIGDFFDSILGIEWCRSAEERLSSDVDADGAPLLVAGALQLTAWTERAVTGRHTRPSPHCGKASRSCVGVWPGSHAHLRRELALKICDAGSVTMLQRFAAKELPCEELGKSHPFAAPWKAEGHVLQMPKHRGKHCAGDCVMLHPHTAHAAAPRYTPSGIRIMVYFRLRATPAMARPEPDDEASESCRQVFFDLPGVASALDESRWSDFLRAADSRADIQKEHLHSACFRDKSPSPEVG